MYKFILTALAALAIDVGSLKADEDLADYIRAKRERNEAEYNRIETDRRLREIEQRFESEERKRQDEANWENYKRFHNW
jgi:hypothetical protein